MATDMPPALRDDEKTSPLYLLLSLLHSQRGPCKPISLAHLECLAHLEVTRVLWGREESSELMEAA